MSIATALDALRRLRLLLADEVERARDERRLLRGLDGTALLERASGRARFNAQLAEAELAVAEGLRALANRAGLTELSLEALRRLAPLQAPAFEDALGEVRALAESLNDLDALNRKLALRAMRVVGGYLDAVTPQTAGYDRSGTRPASRLSSLATRA
ncbi:MAG TPA: flagellar export chaperone FlgN [Myxococcaceae bacterium]|nr:flagellar export chaperone FlgN [Myxococcaceae bacterium]